MSWKREGTDRDAKLVGHLPSADAIPLRSANNATCSRTVVGFAYKYPDF